MTSILDENRYEKKIAFFRERLDTCGYRFYKMIQTRKKEAPKLLNQEENETLQQEVQHKILHSANEYINCLRG
jgi:predicted SprT family Zn-dependent metalloprotease